MAKSFEAVLDEERQDVLALLAAQPKESRHRGSTGSAGSKRASSPFTNPPKSPVPVKSLLDIDNIDRIDNDVAAWHEKVISAANAAKAANAESKSPTLSPRSPRANPSRSLPDINAPFPKSTPPIRSMLDITTPLPAGASQSQTSSPVERSHKAQMVYTSAHPRSYSDAASRPAGFGPRSAFTAGVGTLSAQQFSGYLSNNPGGTAASKRNTQGGKKTSFTSAMAEVVRGGDISAFGRDRGRNSLPGTGSSGFSGAKSKSPHSRFGMRSNSPSLIQDHTKLVLEDGSVIDMSRAYKKLSDANIASSGGSSSSLTRKGSLKKRRESAETKGLAGQNLQKGPLVAEGEGAVESSDDERRSSDDEGPRGRKQNILSLLEIDGNTEAQMPGSGKPRIAQSQMAAAEQESAAVSSKLNGQYKVRSLLEPAITVTAPKENNQKPLKISKPGVHPNTSFDEPSGAGTPFDSDTEADLTDIKRAQKLAVNMTAIVSTPATNRCVRTIYRGDFAKMQQEARDNQRRVRKYLIATDLSDEAAHALEWTIGTVLRDGDTLLAIYCVDEEIGIAEGSPENTHMKEQAEAIAAATKPTGSTPRLTPVPFPSPLGHGFRLDSSNSVSASPMGREKGKAEQDRFRAVNDITERVSKLVRKTKLQVKVVIEVIHCKSPKHLIIEVIDYLSPTLVILGSRGRSALKGRVKLSLYVLPES